MNFQFTQPKPNLKFMVFDGRKTPVEFMAEKNLVFDTWKIGWKNTYQELESKSEPEVNDFLRQSAVMGIFSDQQVVGCHAYSFFNLDERAHSEHPYFQTYDSILTKNLRERGGSEIMTMEYMYINPDWRKSKVGFSVADIICSLALHVFKESTANTLVSVTRNDRKVNDLVYRAGAECLATGLQLHNVKVDIIGFFKDRPYNICESAERDYAAELWNSRIETRESSMQNNRNFQVA